MNRKSILRISTTSLFVLGAMILSSSNAKAEKYKKVINGREVVVHTNPIPVILHRMVPPQYGRHVTKKELSKSAVPRTPATSSVRKP